mgnify:CR=1 FL=1
MLCIGSTSTQPFPQIIDGIEILGSLEKVPVAGKKSKPEQDIRIEEIIIHANPLAT